jgi:hypothetical protein
MKRILILFYSVLIPLALLSQSKSIERFRKSYKEDQNLFFYSSTIKMLNTENEPAFEDLIKDVEKIMVLYYDKEKQQFKDNEIEDLKNKLENEKYVPLLLINEKGSEINLYKRDRKNKTVGFAALIDNKKKLVIIDVKGSIDFRKFMDFKNKIDLRL